MSLEPKVIRNRPMFLPAIWDGKDTSGCIPIGDKILVKPDMAMSRSEGGVEFDERFTDRMQMATFSGVIIAVGDDAFTWSADRMRPFGGYKPKVGDRVYFERYAGAEVQGDDGNKYRLIEDKQIGAVIEKAK